MATMPKGLTAATGMDALTHAIEGYTTKAAWELADCLNLEAIRLIAKSLRAAVNNEEQGREGTCRGWHSDGEYGTVFRRRRPFQGTDVRKFRIVDYNADWAAKSIYRF